MNCVSYTAYIIYPDRQSISSSLRTVLFWALGMHCTCAYTETVDPACRPSIPQVRQGSVRFNLIEDASATCLFQYSYIIYLCCTVYKPHLVISFVIRALFYYPHGASVANIFIKILRLSLRQCTVFRPGTAGPWLAWAWCNFFLPNIKLF